MRRRSLVQALGLSPWLLPALLQAADSGLVVRAGRPPAGSQVQRVFAAGPPAAVLLYCLAPDKMLGWPWPLPEQTRALLNPLYQGLPFHGRLAGRGSTVSMETLLQLAPDLIVDAGNADQTHRSAARRVSDQTGIATVLIEGRLAQSPQQLREAGQLLGVEARGGQLARYAERLLALAARLASGGDERPSVYFARSADGLETGLGEALHSEVIELAGARNVAASLGRGGLARVSLEQLLAWEPDIILTQDREFFTQARRSPLWASLRAVREGRLYCAPSLPFGWLDGPPGINRLLGLHWLLALLYDDPAVADLPQQVANFFRLFYASPATPERLAQVLG